MKRIRRVHPLYWLAIVLFVTAVVAMALTAGEGGGQRTASVYDDGPGGAAALRRFFDAMGASTTTLQGDAFAIDAAKTAVLFILGPSEAITPQDAQAVRRFVAAGGTAVLATDAGLFDRPLLDAFDVHVSGPLVPGRYAVGGIAFADPPAREVAIDRGVTLDVGPGRIPLVTAAGRPIVALAREGSGSFIVVGSIGPFLTGALGEADNGRFALALASVALANERGAGGAEPPRRLVAFDEYHHGVHPTTDVLVLLERTWPGRALVFAGIVLFVYLLATSRRLGPAIPLDPRPPRSSLEYIRGFAGLVRRSGHGEIARRRLRRDLRSTLARQLGLDPDIPFERTLATMAASDRGRAARAKALDDALERPLRDDALLRTVREISRLTTTEDGGLAGPSRGGLRGQSPLNGS